MERRSTRRRSGERIYCIERRAYTAPAWYW